MATMTKCDRCGFYYIDESCSCGSIRAQAFHEVLAVIEMTKRPNEHRLSGDAYYICAAESLAAEVQEMIDKETT